MVVVVDGSTDDEECVMTSGCVCDVGSDVEMIGPSCVESDELKLSVVTACVMWLETVLDAHVVLRSVTMSDIEVECVRSDMSVIWSVSEFVWCEETYC